MDRRNFLAGALATGAAVAAGAAGLLYPPDPRVVIEEVSYMNGFYFLYYAEGHHSEAAFRHALRAYLVQFLGEEEAAELASEVSVAHEYFADHGVNELDHVHVGTGYVTRDTRPTLIITPRTRPVTSTGWV